MPRLKRRVIEEDDDDIGSVHKGTKPGDTATKKIKNGTKKEEKGKPKDRNVLSLFGNFHNSKTRSEEVVEDISDHENDDGSMEVVTVTKVEDHHPLTLWTDRYAPTTIGQLAVHKKKVEEVEEWMLQAQRPTTRSKLLILYGPAGCGKSATVRTIARKHDFGLIEWENPQKEQGVYEPGSDSLSTKFEEFIAKSSKYQPLSHTSAHNEMASTRTILLIDEIPYVYGNSAGARMTRQSFRNSILSYLNSSRSRNPIVIVFTEVTIARDANDLSSFSIKQDVDYTPQGILGNLILNAPPVAQITFNQIAPTILWKALKEVLKSENVSLTKSAFDNMSISSCGDIRSTLNALQFGAVQASSSIAATRSSSTNLFHQAGKVIYNKRAGDVAGESRESDRLLLPPFLRSSYTRSRAMVDVNELLGDVADDLNSLVSTVAVNYIPSCFEVEEVSDIADGFSDSDLVSSRIHSSGLVMLHATIAIRSCFFFLPSPVNKREGAWALKGPLDGKYYRRQQEVQQAISVCQHAGIESHSGNSAEWATVLAPYLKWNLEATSHIGFAISEVNNLGAARNWSLWTQKSHDSGDKDYDVSSRSQWQLTRLGDKIDESRWFEDVDDIELDDEL